MCIIGRTKDLWLKAGEEEEEEFKQDLAKEIIALEWWDPTNPTDDSICYEEEKMVKTIKGDDLWYIDDNNEEREEENLHAQEEIDHLTRSGCHYKPQELEKDHLGLEIDKGKGKEFDKDEEEDQVLKLLKKTQANYFKMGVTHFIEKSLIGHIRCTE